MGGRRIESNIGEIKIQGDQDAVFLQTGIEDLMIRTAAEPLVDCGMGVVAGGDKEFESFSREILVELEAHGHPL